MRTMTAWLVVLIGGILIELSWIFVSAGVALKDAGKWMLDLSDSIA